MLSEYADFFPPSQGSLAEAVLLSTLLGGSTTPMTFHTCFVILANMCMAMHWTRLRNWFNQINLFGARVFLFLIMPDRFSKPLKTWPSCRCGSTEGTAEWSEEGPAEVNYKALPPKHLLRFNVKWSKIQQLWFKNMTWSVTVTQITNLNLHHSSSVLYLNTLYFNSSIP